MLMEARNPHSSFAPGFSTKASAATAPNIIRAGMLRLMFMAAV